MRHALSPTGAASWLLLLCTTALFLAGCAAEPQSAAKQVNHGWTKDEVSDSYIFAYPLVLMTSARAAAAAGGQAGEVNKLHRARIQPAVDDAALPPWADLDTLASTAWLDLSDGPAVVSLPNTRGEYLDMRVLDMWTNVVWSTGPGANARGFTKPRAIAFVPPGWVGTLPAGVERVDAPSNNLWLLVRLAATGPREVPIARRLQAELRVTPWTAFAASAQEQEHTKRGKHAKRAKPPKSEADEATDDSDAGFVDTPAALAAQVAALDADAFFARAGAALRDNPPVPADPHALAILADLGVKPGEPAHLPKGAADAIASGLAAARASLATAPVNAFSGNGWTWLGDGVGHYGDDYALRAYAAFTRPGSGTKDDEVVATTTVDANGEALDGRNRYVLHFPARAIPPVRGFWTLTAYTAGGALASGRLQHRSIASRDGLRRNRDGSIDVYVQAASPGRARQTNWVPAPEGAFALVLRLYAPQGVAADGNWQPSPLVRK